MAAILGFTTGCGGVVGLMYLFNAGRQSTAQTMPQDRGSPSLPRLPAVVPEISRPQPVESPPPSRVRLPNPEPSEQLAKPIPEAGSETAEQEATPPEESTMPPTAPAVSGAEEPPAAAGRVVDQVPRPAPAPDASTGPLEKPPPARAPENMEDGGTNQPPQ